MQTTLNNIRMHSPCTEGWTKLLSSLNKTKADDEVLELSHILESNGLDDALWCLRAVKGIDKEARLFAVFCARQVQHLNNDPVVKNAIDVAERFANGEANVEELNAAYAAARSAVACSAAYSAAYAAARSATDACYVATDARYAAYYAATDACYAAYYATAASFAARKEQKQKFIEMFC